MKLEKGKTIRAARLSIALFISFFITWYFEIPEGMWMLITCCFVVFEFTTFGGVSKKSWLRFLATFSSAIYSIFIIYLFNNNAIVNLVALMVGVFIYGYLFLDQKDVYVSVLGCVTLALTLINYNRTDLALLRPFNIALGVLVSIIVFKLFYPVYAKDRIMSLQLDFVAHLCQILENFLDPTQSLEAIKANYLIHETSLQKDILLFNQLLEETKMEVKKTSPFISANLDGFSHAKRIYRLISVFIYHVASDNLREDHYVSTYLKKILTQLEALRLRISELTEALEDNVLAHNEIVSLNQDKIIVNTLLESILNEITCYNKALNTINPIRLNNHHEFAL